MDRPIVWTGPNRPDQASWGPYEGCLIVMNVGASLPPVPDHYQEILMEQVAKAHAGGWLVLYVFDKGAEPPEEFLEFIENVDQIRPIQFYGRKDADFSILPDARQAEFAAVAQGAFADKHFRFEATSAKIMGRCHIGGKETFIPVTNL